MGESGSGPRKPVLAVFDFDGTLTFADSMVPFLREVAGTGCFWLGLARLMPKFLSFKLGRIDNKTAKEAFFRRFLEGRRLEELEPVIARFLGGRLAGLLNPVALARLRWHQDEGHHVVVVSASPELYLKAWGKSAGISEVLGTRLEIAGGVLTGRIQGANCHGPEKVARLTEALGSLSQFSLHAYGDSRGDRELLAAAQVRSYRALGSPGLIRRMLAFVRALL
jgi:phosphatidylglycerophosphatase C